jgi:hypothetical protein
MPMKVKDVAAFISECNGINSEPIHQGIVDILLPFRSRGREISDREVTRRRESAGDSTSGHFHHEVSTRVSTSDVNGKRVVKKEVKSIMKGGIPAMKMKR